VRASLLLFPFRATPFCPARCRAIISMISVSLQSSHALCLCAVLSISLILNEGLYGRLARTLLKTKQFSEALEYAENALEAFPSSAKICFMQVK